MSFDAPPEDKAPERSNGSFKPRDMALGFSSKAMDEDAECETYPLHGEWAALRESIETMLESQFRRQEGYIQRCLEQLLLPCGCSIGEPGIFDCPNGKGWRQSLETSMRRIEGLLEEQAAASSEAPHSSRTGRSPPNTSPRQLEVPQQDARLRRQGTPDFRETASWSSAGTGRRPFSPRPTIGEEAHPPDTQRSGGGGLGLPFAPAGSAGSSWGARGSGGGSAGPAAGRAQRPPSSAASVRSSQQTKLQRSTTQSHWQIVVQDRCEMGSWRSSASLSWKEFYEARFFKLLDWWLSLEEPERKGCLAGLVLAKKFEAICAAVIIANALFAAYTTNYEVAHLQGEQPPLADAVECGFLGFYLVELLLKLCVHRLFFFANEDMRWNIFDLLLVLFSIYYQISVWLITVGGMDLSYLRTLRVVKLARILRVIRVAKVFTALRLMLNSILGSFMNLFWSFVMLTFVFYIFGLIFVQGTASYLTAHAQDLDQDSLDKINRAFGSVQRSMLSLYKATTGGTDWENIFDDPIIERMGALSVSLFIFLIAFIQVALLNILTGVFVESALKLAQPDRETLALEHRKKELFEAAELRQLCEGMDDNHSGTIDPEVFDMNLRRNGKLRAHLQVLGLHIKDAELFFEMLMAESDVKAVDIEDFVAACMRLRGNATSLDLQAVLFCVKNQNKRLKSFVQTCDYRFNDVASRLGELSLAAGITTRSPRLPWHGEAQQQGARYGSEGGGGPAPRQPDVYGFGFPQHTSL